MSNIKNHAIDAFLKELPRQDTPLAPHKAALMTLYNQDWQCIITNNKTPPFHVVEPSLWYIAKTAYNKFKNYLLNKLR